MLAQHHINRMCSVAMVFGVVMAGCNRQGTAREPNGEGVLQGKWKEAGFDIDKTVPKDQSNMVAFLLAMSEMDGPDYFLFNGKELTVQDSTGKVVRREPYLLKDSLIFLEGDTAVIRWSTPDKFAFYAVGVRTFYERVQESGH